MTKIRVRMGHAEAEVDADPEHLREAIDLIPLVAAKIAVSGGDPALEQREPQVLAPTELPERPLAPQLPMVSVEKGDSLADVISKFFAGPWGRERRKLSDVREALQSYGLNYPKQSVAVALLRLAKTTKLRRFKADDGEFVYTSTLNMPGPLQPSPDQILSEVTATQPN